MGRSGVLIGKGSVGADASALLYAISGLLVNGIATASVALGTTFTINSLREAEGLGLDAAYDSASNVCVHRHISEFYRLAGDGTELNFMLCPQTVTPANMFGDAYGKKLAIDAKGRIKRLALAYNPANTYAPTTVDGMESDIRAAIPAAQAFSDWADTTFRPLHVLLEGRGVSATASTAINLRAITVTDTVIEYNQVSLMIGQDWDYAETLGAIGKKMADVGTLLGACASGRVNQHPGEVGRVNLTDATKGLWLTAGISSHTKIAAIDADLSVWDSKGYILCWDYQDDNAPGYRISADHVCAPIIQDADGNMNESTIALSCTNAKVRRELRSVYLPKVNSVVALTKSTGKMPIGIVKSLEKIGNDVFGGMEAQNELSGGATTVDPNSNLLTGDRILSVGYNWVPEGTIGQINGLVNIKSALS